MDQLEEIMSPKGFIRIHKTYLVNGLYVYKIKGEKVILNDKSEITVKPYQNYRSKGAISDFSTEE